MFAPLYLLFALALSGSSRGDVEIKNLYLRHQLNIAMWKPKMPLVKLRLAQGARKNDRC